MKNSFIKLSFFLIGIITLNSCVKSYDKNFNTSYDEKMVMINYAINQPINNITIEPPATGNIELDLGNISISSAKPNESTVTVNLVINNTLLADYNTTNFTNLVPFPSNAIVMPLTFTIPAGEKQVPIKATINPALISLSNTYAIGLSIANLTGNEGYKINDLYKNCLFAFIIKNKYDGAYTLRGFHNRTPYTFPFLDVPMELHTSGASSVRFYFPDAGDYGHPIGISAGTYSWYGNTVGPALNMDPATNVITSAINVGTAGNAPPIDLTTSINPNPRFTFNTTTGKPLKCYVTFRYNANDLRSFIDTLTYVGPR